MAAQSRVEEVIDALVDRMRARAGFRDPGAPGSGIPVHDGPELELSEDLAGTYLVVGWSGAPDGPEPAASSQLAQGPMGPQHTRDETATVECMAVGASGDGPGAMRAARLAARTVMDAVAEECRTDPTLGLAIPPVVGGIRTQAFVTAGQLLQSLAEHGGFIAERSFTVSFTSRL